MTQSESDSSKTKELKETHPLTQSKSGSSESIKSYTKERKNTHLLTQSRLDSSGSTIEIEDTDPPTYEPNHEKTELWKRDTLKENISLAEDHTWNFVRPPERKSMAIK